MRRLVGRLWLWLGLAVLPAVGLGLGPALAGSDTACAAATSGAPHAALVIDTGSGVSTYCVALGASSINGIQLVRNAGTQFGLSYRLGFGGQAVCMLEGVGGPPGDDCLTGQTSYWGFWIGDGSGGWTWSSTGAASVSVSSGDVQGWAWGVGMDGTTHPQPPGTSIDEVCKAAPSPRPAGGGGGGGGGSASPSPRPSASPSTTSSPSARPSPHHRSPSPRPRPAGSKTHTPAADRTQVAAAAPLGSTGSGGSPVGVLLAVLLAAALGVGGWLRVRSGRSKATR